MLTILWILYSILSNCA